MFIITQRLVPFLAIILLTAASTAVSLSQSATEQAINSPVIPGSGKPTTSPTQELSPVPTGIPVIPRDTFTPTETPLPMVGSAIIAFGSNRDGDTMNIYTMNIPDRSTTQLTKNESNTFPGPYSPNKAKLLFTGFGLSHSYVGVMNADGSGEVRLTNGNEIDYGPAWSPDGKQIAFRADTNGNSDIFVFNADGTGRVNLTNNPASDWSPTWSPDGSKIAFQTNRDGNWEIYVMNSDGTQQTNLTDNPANDQMPYWKPVVSTAN